MNNTCILSHSPPVMYTILTDKEEITEKIRELKLYGFTVIYTGNLEGLINYSKYFRHTIVPMYNLYDSYITKGENKHYSFTYDFEECLRSIDTILQIQSIYAIISLIE